MGRAAMALAISVVMIVASGSAFAMQRGKGAGPKPKAPTGQAHAPKGPKVPGVAKAPGGAKAPGAVKPRGGAAGGKSAPRSASTPAKAKGSAAAKTSAGKTSTTTTTATTATPAPAPAGTYSPVQQKLQKNTRLAAKLSGRLPAGTDVIAAASGFRNLGQFVAAVNVSSNLGIPFAQLKSRMVDEGMSLGRSIQELRPSVDSATAVRRAERDATIIIDGSGSESTTSAKPKSQAKPKARKTSGGD